MKFRKKPVVIDAIQWTGDNYGDLKGFVGDQLHHTKSADLGDSVKIATLEGVMVVSVGDWIIRGVKGEFYPCKPDIFAATYEAVEGPRHYPPGMQDESQRLHREYNALVAAQRAGAKNGADVVSLTDEANAKGITLVPGGENL